VTGLGCHGDQDQGSPTSCRPLSPRSCASGPFARWKEGSSPALADTYPAAWSPAPASGLVARRPRCAGPADAGRAAARWPAPGLRLAWLALPPWLLEPVMEVKGLADRHNSALDQLVLADLLTSEAFDRHLRHCRRRRDRLGAAVAEHTPTLRPPVSPPACTRSGPSPCRADRAGGRRRRHQPLGRP
jgi:hypothetical protein